MISFGIDYIKNNPETINGFFGEVLSFCENFELQVGENRNVIMIYRNKLDKPQLSIVGISRANNLDVITNVKKSFTSENLFELLKKQEK